MHSEDVCLWLEAKPCLMLGENKPCLESDWYPNEKISNFPCSSLSLELGLLLLDMLLPVHMQLLAPIVRPFHIAFFSMYLYVVQETMTNSREERQSVRGGEKKNNDNESISDELQHMEQHIPQHNC